MNILSTNQQHVRGQWIGIKALFLMTSASERLSRPNAQIQLLIRNRGWAHKGKDLRYTEEAADMYVSLQYEYDRIVSPHLSCTHSHDLSDNFNGNRNQEKVWYT